jgi:hypothetical protein
MQAEDKTKYSRARNGSHDSLSNAAGRYRPEANELSITSKSVKVRFTPSSYKFINTNFHSTLLSSYQNNSNLNIPRTFAILPMEDDYSSNPAISLLCEQIEPGSKEQEVQALWESLLWTVFPATGHWITHTKYKQGATEPDNKVMKLIQYHTGWATMDVLAVELKRPREKVTLETFNTVARDLLDDHMSESNNPDGTTLFGAVGIGHHVVFYNKELPRGRLQTIQTRPFHLLTDAPKVQEYFDYYKLHIPQWPSPDAAPNPAPPLTGLSSSSTSYQAPASSYQAPGSSYEYQAPASNPVPAPSDPAPAPSNPAPTPGYQEGDNKYTGDLETKQADIQYIAVEVTKKGHLTRPDEFFFRDKNGKERVTTRDGWLETRASGGHRCWIYHQKYVCYQNIFRK